MRPAVLAIWRGGENRAKPAQRVRAHVEKQIGFCRLPIQGRPDFPLSGHQTLFGDVAQVTRPPNVAMSIRPTSVQLRRASIIAAVFVSAALCGCATGWGEREKAKLASVHTPVPRVVPNAYRKPDATDSPGMARDIPQFTGGGLIPALIGEAIDAGVTSKQQRKFEATEAKHFPALERMMATAPVEELQSAIQRTFSTHEFFGPRLAAKGGAALSTEIVGYGFEKSPLSKSQDDLLLRVRIQVRAALTAEDGEVLWSGAIAGVAATAKHAGEIVEDPAFLTTGLREAADDFAQQLLVELEIKLGARPPHRGR